MSASPSAPATSDRSRLLRELLDGLGRLTALSTSPVHIQHTPPTGASSDGTEIARSSATLARSIGALAKPGAAHESAAEMIRLETQAQLARIRQLHGMHPAENDAHRQHPGAP